MTQILPSCSPEDQNLLKYLLEDALHILKKQVTNPESKDFKKITHLLKKCEVFQSTFPSQACLNDFVQLAKYYVSYEVHEYGTVLLREKEYADKFCLVLKGSVEKFRQKPYGEIEKEVHEERSRKSIAMGSMDLPNFSMPSLNLQGSTCKSPNHRPSRFIEPVIPTRSPSPIEKDTRLQGSNEPADGEPQVSDVGLLNLHMLATEKEVCEQNEEEAEKSSEEDDFTVPLKKFITDNVQNPPPISKFSKKLERLNIHSFPKRFSEEMIKGGAVDETPLAGTRINLSEEELIRHICKRDSEIKKTYFMEDVLRATKIKTYKAGEYFGESFCRPNFPKSNSMLAVSSEQVHLLVLSREDYNNIMNELERRGNEKLEVFWSIFPLADKKTVREFSQQFSQKSYQVDEVIYSQDDPAQDLHLLLSGEVKLCKGSDQLCEEGASPVSKKRITSLSIGEIPMVTVIKNQFFGEEPLLDIEYRQSTAVAKSPNTATYLLESHVYEKIKEKFVGFFEVLKKAAQDKFAWRQQKLSEANENSTNNTLSLSPIRVQKHKSSKSILSPRTSILLPDPQGSQKKLSIFLSSQKIPSQTEKSNVSSPRSSIPSFDDKQIQSEDDLSPQKQKSGIYKSQFARKLVSVVIPNDEESKEEDKAKKANIRKSVNLGPLDILESCNLRRDLYGDKKRVSHFVSPRTNKKPSLPPLFDSPRISKPKNETGPQESPHKPKQTSLAGMQNFLPTHVIFERFISKKNSAEYFSARSYENSPKNTERFENLHVGKKAAPNKLRFK